MPEDTARVSIHSMNLKDPQYEFKRKTLRDRKRKYDDYFRKEKSSDFSL